MQPTSVPEPVFINVEYLFFLVARFFASVFSLAFLEKLRLFATIILIIVIAVVLYLLVRLYELKQEEKRKKNAMTAAQQAPTAPPTGLPTSSVAADPGRNEVWEGIRSKLLSDNQSDWRLAIIEADIYMDRLLDEKGYHGDTTSDKLKQIATGDLASVQIAWEAHKVRNRIAHDGAAFDLTQPEARRVLSYFEIVFRDLGAIE